MPLIMLIALFTSLLIVVAGGEVLFLINSQDDNFYKRAQTLALRRHILDQRNELDLDYVVDVRLMHEIFNYPGDWNLLDALSYMAHAPALGEYGSAPASLINDNTKWIILCEYNTHVALSLLLENLSHEDHTQANFFGYALHDEEATIVHHFAFFKNPSWFPYPMLSAGVVFTGKLLRDLATLLADSYKNNNNDVPTTTRRHSDFSIDGAYELARFIYENLESLSFKFPKDYGGMVSTNNNTSDGINTKMKKLVQSQEEMKRKVIMRSTPYICGATVRGECALYAKSTFELSCTGKRSQIYFAIKTCEKFHKERIPIIERTWSSYALHKKYYSDVGGE